MSDELEVQRKFRSRVPESHRGSLDTRLQWLWMQRFGTVQTIWMKSPDVLDKTACTVILQALLAHDLRSINLLFQRLEGASISDREQLERSDPPLRV